MTASVALQQLGKKRLAERLHKWLPYDRIETPKQAIYLIVGEAATRHGYLISINFQTKTIGISFGQFCDNSGDPLDLCCIVDADKPAKHNIAYLDFMPDPDYETVDEFYNWLKQYITKTILTITSRFNLFFLRRLDVVHNINL